MQAPADSPNLGSVYPPEPSKPATAPPYQWLSSTAADETETGSGAASILSAQDLYVQDASGQDTYSQALFKPNASRPWQVGGAITGTAALSAGLATVFAGDQALSVPAGDAYLPNQQGRTSEVHNNLAHTPAKRAIALSQGQGISPHVGQAQQVVFSGDSGTSFISNQSTSQPSSQLANRSTSNLTDTLASTQPTMGRPTLVPSQNGGWSLIYEDSVTSSATPEVDPLPTQTLVNQLAAQGRRRQSQTPTISAAEACMGTACRGLDYINAQLPQARQNVEVLQQQIENFEAQHAQSDLQSYQQVLSSRLSEIASQKTKITLELSDTRRYIGQIKVRLRMLNVDPDLAEHLLALDNDYQTGWLQLQQTERQLLAEFSQANINSTRLNQIYNSYEQQQLNLYQAAQAVFGNYLLSATEQNPNQHAIALYQSPSALDLLQLLTVATHQRDVEQLRDRTVRLATENLQARSRDLASNISEYESLKRELNTAESIVAQYEEESARIATEASVRTATAAAATGFIETPTRTYQDSPAFAAAQVLESQVQEGSIAKTLLGIVVAVGAVAIATQRRAGNLSEALSIEIYPQPKPKPFSLQPAKQLLAQPAQSEFFADLLAPNLLAPSGQPRTLTIAAGPSFSQLPAATAPQTLSRSVESIFTEEAISRELHDLVGQAAPEVSFAKEVSLRKEAPVVLSLDEIETFAENAVRWVLKDIGTYTQPLASKPVAETVLVGEAVEV